MTPTDPMDPESALLAKEEPTPLQPRIRSRAHREKMRWAVEQLPVQEREVMQLLLQGKSQPEVGIILGLARSTVFCRVRRAKERIQWWVTHGSEFTERELEAAGAFVTPKQAAVLVALWRTSSLRIAAEELGIATNSAVVRYQKAMATLAKRSLKYPSLRKLLAPLASMTRGKPGHCVRVFRLDRPSDWTPSVRKCEQVAAEEPWHEPGARSRAFIDSVSIVDAERDVSGAPVADLPDES